MGLLAQLELEYESDDVEKFLHFFRIMADSLEPLIIKLESKAYKTALKEIQSLAHNTAWAARRLKLDEITDFCVFCEDIMQQALRFDGPASAEFIDWLLLLSEQCENYCKSYEQDAENLAFFNPLLVKLPSKLSN
ncbi:hypothetical protein CAV_1519 [Campylobacter avium LMG 24591]|uniref:HPt domain-containing protein n=1 Tax=Campylobacter avium LMG 24591 TaxID=522484 RepID=A0A222MYP5_9BACT|nr:histidine phosphotransferase [Campylobacter avium]ASQ31127.1 hypothetical protein CAV_1519 [Campylobacter avium LMG 24591]OYD78510.1 hypothetical protein CAV8706_1515 [Campylobacter avium]